jgi:inositol transport system substrate-binding protein
MSRFHPGIACLTITACALAGCSAGRSSSSGGAAGGPVVGVSLMNLSYEYIVMLNRSMDQRSRELGVRLIVNDAQRNAEKQVQQVESFIAQKVDAIIMNPCEVEASAPAVDKALAAGIPIINVNSETRTPPTVFVGSRDEDAGRIAMQYIAQRLGSKGNVVMMRGFMGQAAEIKRSQGAREVLAQNPGLHLLAEQTAEWDRAKGMNLMENWIQSYGDRIDALYAQNDEMAMGALMAIEQGGRRRGKIIVVGVDAIADALQAVRDGRLDATVFQDARNQGRSAVEAAARLIKHQSYEKQVLIPFQLVTRDNVDQYLGEHR